MNIKVTQRKKKVTLGLALGGGVARGWAHIGAIKALRDANIEPENYCRYFYRCSSGRILCYRKYR